MTFWHCGNAAPSVHNLSDRVACATTRWRARGTAFWCSLKEGPVTAARFSNIDGQYKLFLLRGTALPHQPLHPRRHGGRGEDPVMELVHKIAETA